MYALRCILKSASTRWDLKQWARWASGEGGSSRMSDACSGQATDKIYAKAEALFTSGERWITLRRRAVCWMCAGLALCMLSCTLCALEQLLFSEWRGYPYKVFGLLLWPTEAFAAELLSDPICMKDLIAAIVFYCVSLQCQCF